MGANFKYESLGELAGKFNLAVRCRCGHLGVLDSQKLTRLFFVKRWDSRKSAIGAHLRCSRCGARPIRWGITARLPAGPEWGPRDEQAWQRLIRRLRG